MEYTDTIIMIPARLGSSRLPNKPLLKINGIPLIIHAYNCAKSAKLNAPVVVATDDKLIFKTVIEQSMSFLAIVGLLSTVIAAIYYLRIIKIIYFDKEKEKYDSDHGIWLKFSLTFSTILILLYFIFPSQLIEVVSRIIII